MAARTARGGLTATALLLVTFLVLSLAPVHAYAGVQTERREQFLTLTNADREARDREALDLEKRLSRYATRHSRDMAEAGYLYHSTEAELRGALNGYDWSIAGENVGVASSLESLEDAFMASKLHRENILRSEFEHIAIGIVKVDDAYWITVVFYGN